MKILPILASLLLAQSPRFNGQWIPLTNGQFINSEVKTSSNDSQIRIYLVTSFVNGVEYQFFYVGFCEENLVGFVGMSVFEDGVRIKSEGYEEAEYFPPDPLEKEAFEYACNRSQ